MANPTALNVMLAALLAGKNLSPAQKVDADKPETKGGATVRFTVNEAGAFEGIAPIKAPIKAPVKAGDCGYVTQGRADKPLVVCVYTTNGGYAYVATMADGSAYESPKSSERALAVCKAILASYKN